MNTRVPYRMPSSRNRFGQYVSRTIIDDTSIQMLIQIDLVWFSKMGWYYVVDIKMWSSDRLPIEHKMEVSKYTWPKGTQLSDCALAAEEAVKRLCGSLPNLAPYELKETA